MTRHEHAAMNALVDLISNEVDKKNNILSLNKVHSEIYDGKYITIVDGHPMAVSYETDASNVFHVRNVEEHPHDAKRVFFNEHEMFVREM